MNRVVMYALAAVAGAATTMIFTNPPVDLQAATPGVAQTGNANISGKFIAGTVSATNSSASAQAVIGDATSTSGSTFGGLFKTASPSGTGVRGVSSNASSGNGGTFQSAGTSGAGARGFATSATGVNFGLFGQTVSPNGIAVMGNSTAASGGIGVYGQAANNGWAGFFAGRLNVTGEAIANLFTGSGAGLTSLNGSNIASGTVALGRLPAEIARQDLTNNFTQLNLMPGGAKIGTALLATYPLSAGRAGTTGPSALLFNTASASATIGSGVVGSSHFAEAGAGSSVQGIYSRGVLNYNVGACNGGSFYAVGGDTAIGAYGNASGGSINFAGYFQGVLYATSASSGVKAFLIDHPLDPANKTLSHSSVESDERRNMYWGSVVTDGQGYATVTMPTWFEALNEDVKYQLTVVDEADSADFVLAKVTRRLASGKFTLRTSKPGVAVDWQVAGRRHDATARFHPLVVEELKKPHQRGRYLDPEAYGFGQEMSVVPPDMGVETHKDPTSSR